MTSLADEVEQYRLADHIEMVHERELAEFFSLSALRKMHREMHAVRDDWGHDEKDLAL